MDKIDAFDSQLDMDIEIHVAKEKLINLFLSKN